MIERYDKLKEIIDNISDTEIRIRSEYLSGKYADEDYSKWLANNIKRHYNYHGFDVDVTAEKTEGQRYDVTVKEREPTEIEVIIEFKD